MTNPDGVDFVKMQSDVAVILSVCENIQEDLAEVKSVAKSHDTRIRTLEVGQGELRAEIKAKGIIAVVVASVVAFLTEIISKTR